MVVEGNLMIVLWTCMAAVIVLSVAVTVLACILCRNASKKNNYRHGSPYERRTSYLDDLLWPSSRFITAQAWLHENKSPLHYMDDSLKNYADSAVYLPPVRRKSQETILNESPAIDDGNSAIYSRRVRRTSQDTILNESPTINDSDSAIYSPPVRRTSQETSLNESPTINDDDSALYSPPIRRTSQENWILKKSPTINVSSSAIYLPRVRRTSHEEIILEIDKAIEETESQGSEIVLQPTYEGNSHHQKVEKIKYEHRQNIVLEPDDVIVHRQNERFQMEYLSIENLTRAVEEEPANQMSSNDVLIEAYELSPQGRIKMNKKRYSLIDIQIEREKKSGTGTFYEENLKAFGDEKYRLHGGSFQDMTFMEY